MRGKLRALLLIGSCSVLALLGCQSLQRRALFHPTHHAGDSGLARWSHEGSLVGLAREVPSPDNIWLMLPGNTGQAADRARMLQVFPARDSVYILEYPGYGQRSGKPSRRTIDAAALAAYQLLRARYAGRHVCVAGESIGSGPAATLGALPQPPDKLGDLGYWVGYRIAKAYWLQSSDKRAALAKILQVTDARAFLAKSGWYPGIPLEPLIDGSDGE